MILPSYLAFILYGRSPSRTTARAFAEAMSVMFYKDRSDGYRDIVRARPD